ncbi:MAG: MerR family transcriptional regulator [Streptosporangiaceae bacterium]
MTGASDMVTSPMSPSSLTIGQLAAHVGVTVRAIRHYHALGLLPEPARDASGYRRYDAQAVVDLIRIKTLADAGVPLARIGQLLGAEPAEFSEAVTDIGRALAAKIRQLQQHRRRVAQLAQGERLFLADGIVDILERMRAMGVSEQSVRMERDGWILLSALSPELAAGWAGQKKAALDDPDFQRLYLAFDQARDWDPADPRLEQLAARALDWVTQHPDMQAEVPEPSAGLSAAAGLIAAKLGQDSPALQHLADMAREWRAVRPRLLR